MNAYENLRNIDLTMHLKYDWRAKMNAIDVQGLPKEKVNYLQRLVAQWKLEQEPAPEQEEDVNPSDFIVKHSNVKGGIITREMAYE
jgi:hypothetical protein